MLFDTSYKDKKIERKINETVGPSFSFAERWKLKGIGSKRFSIKSVSEEYRGFVNAAHYISNANLELRPKGIIVHFRHKLQAYSWIMPFSDLVVENKTALHLMSDGKHITFGERLDDAFFDKMERVKNTLLKQ